MLMRSGVWAALYRLPYLVLLLISFPIFADAGLGRAVRERSVDDLTVYADGSGLPKGKGNATAGERLFHTHCVACHGNAGSGGLNDTLAGGAVPLNELVAVRTIGSYWPYAFTVFDYVRRTMPYTAPGSLTDNEVYALVAYLLYVNDLWDESRMLDRDSLLRMKMPARQRFFSDYELPR